jgi:glycosyltransferase involved in cell wall biosynthesis
MLSTIDKTILPEKAGNSPKDEGLKLKASVIICSHNPRTEALDRVLLGLRNQSLPILDWEFLLIDNASAKPLAEYIDLSWHPYGRIIKESALGLTQARLRGIAESRSNLLVFVDDDNVLSPDYLQQALHVAERFPMLGAFGGSCKGEFEVPPPPWIEPYLPGLVVQEIDRDYWSNAYEWSLACPYGAGMCVRRLVADEYVRRIQSNPLSRKLGRSGKQLLAGEDTDLAWTAIDLNFGTGRFCALRLTHLIPRGRTESDYIIRLNAGFAFSKIYLDALRGGKVDKPRPLWRDLLQLTRECLKTSGVDRRVRIAAWRARRNARQSLVDGGSPSN